MSALGVWRYAPWLPVRHATQGVSLGEGDTPLVPVPRWGAAHGLRRVYAKLEFVSPTGSFKDRGMAVLVTLARQAGTRHLVEDSSGNAGASAAAYAARAGMTCTVYAPAAAPPAKLRQIRMYGADLVAVPGPRTAVAEVAHGAGLAPGSYHVAHNENPLFLAGNKTFGYELVEALPALQPGSRPWHVVIPTGGGALFSGAWQGFQECAAGTGPAPLAQGQLPRMHVAQAAACAPLAVAWEAGLGRPALVTRRPTVCGGIEIERPTRGREILAAVRASGGAAAATEDDAVLLERDRLAHLEGIYAEPTSAAAFAVLVQLAHRGLVSADDVVIVAVTGSGLKDAGE